MRCSNDGSVYEPDGHFREDIVRFTGEVRGECPYIPSECPTPDYKILSSGQRDYYFFWRSQLRMGECLRTDDGYVWLFLCEIANSDVPYAEASRQLSVLQSGCGYLRSRDLVRSASMDLAIVRGEDLPHIWVWGWDKRRFMALSEMMSPPVDRMELAFMVRLAGNPEVYYEDEARLEDLMNLAMLRIDRRLTLDTGIGIAETYGREARADHTVFRGLKYYGDCDEYVIAYTDLDNSEFRKFMLGLLRYSEQVLFKLDNIRGPSAPSAFTNQMRRMTEGALDDILSGRGDDIRGPKDSRGTVRTPLSSRERMLIDVGRDTFGVDDPFSDTKPDGGDNGTMNVDLSMRSRTISRTFRADMEAHRETVAGTEFPYVPSGYTNPDYRSFDEAQKGFYLSWREKVRNGEYPDTDYGYVWLFLCELINSETDAAKAMDILRGMGLVYEDDTDSRPLIRGTYMDYAIVNGVDTVDPVVIRNDLTVNVAIGAAVEGDLDMLDRDTLLNASGIGSASLRADFDEACCAATCRTLKRIDRLLSSEGGLVGACGVTSAVYKVHPFNRLRYYGNRPPTVCEYIDYTGNRGFHEVLRTVMKCAIAVIRKRKGRRVSIPAAVVFGMDCRRIVEEEVGCWFDPPAASAGRRAREIVLDRSAVDDAERALNDVTEMMSTEYSKEEETLVQDIAVEGVPDPQPDNPWSQLMSSLTPDERSYLLVSLDGGVRTDPRTEDSVNAKALGCVGDVVMENGIVFEEYADDIRRTAQ